MRKNPQVTTLPQSTAKNMSDVIAQLRNRVFIRQTIPISDITRPTGPIIKRTKRTRPILFSVPLMPALKQIAIEKTKARSEADRTFPWDICCPFDWVIWRASDENFRGRKCLRVSFSGTFDEKPDLVLDRTVRAVTVPERSAARGVRRGWLGVAVEVHEGARSYLICWKMMWVAIFA